MMLVKRQESQLTPELRSNMAAPCAASEVAVSLKAENSITGHVAPSASLYAGMGVHFESWFHTVDLNLEDAPWRCPFFSSRTRQISL